MRTRTRRFVWTLLTLVAGTVLFSGCGKSNSDSDSADKEVTLSYASWDTSQAIGLKKVLEEFEKENPTIKVKMETTPWEQYWTKMEAAATGENLSDIVTMHSSESYKYMSNDMLMKLDDVVEAEKIDMDNFMAGISDLYSYEDSLYAIPKDTTTIAIWYNKKLFDEAGVAYPTADWTWDEFLETAQKLTDEAKGIYGCSANNATEGGFWPVILQNEGTIYDKDGTKSGFGSENTMAAISWYNDLINKYHVSPTIENLAETDQMTLFGSGKLAMMSNGNWIATSLNENENLKGNLACVELPKGKVKATVSNGLGWSISAKTKHPEEAKKLIAFLASEKANKIQAETGASIPAYKGVGDYWTKSFSDIDLEPFVTSLDFAQTRPFNKETTKTETIEVETLSKVFSNKLTVQEGCQQIQKAVDAVLAE